MAQQNPTVISVHLDDEKLRKSIDKLVSNIHTKLSEAAQKFDTNIGKMQTSLNNFAANAKITAKDIKDTFTSLGMSFEQFARAMQRAARAASGMTGGSGSGGGGGRGATPATPGSVEELKQQIAAQQKLIDQQQQYSANLQREVNLLAAMRRNLKNMLTDTDALTKKNIKNNLAWTKNLSENDIAQVTRKLRELEIVRSQMMQNFRLFNSAEIQGVTKQIDRLTLKLEKMRSVVQMPKNFQGIMGMSEKTLDDIQRKMQAISQYRMTLPVNSPQLAQLNREYQRLGKLQNEAIGNNTRLARSNDALARSFNYIRNRLIYFATIGTITNFVRQLYEVRGQYELLERSLGVLFNSFKRGSQIFQELSNMAIQSPFTLIELGTAAKQLAAYNFEATEVVNVTKRLADISAALGVPMERLVYNLGQIRAQGRLTARDARDFANAGLAIVPELAKMYSKVEQRVVSTADVYDRMTKKAVSYNDVMTVLNGITDEGGKFFDFQAKQADTLRVQLANLTLAWNNMLNDIGKSHQTALAVPIQLLKQLFINWRSVSNILTTMGAAFGLVKVAQIAMNRTIGASVTVLNKSILANKKKVASDLERKALTTQLTQEELRLLATRKMVTAADYQNILSTKNLSKAQAMLMIAVNRKNLALKQAVMRMGLLTAAEIRSINFAKIWSLTWKNAFLSLKTGLSGLAGLFKAALPMVLISGIIELASAFIHAGDAAREFNRAVSEGQKESLESLNKFTEDYASIYRSLYEWNENEGGGFSRGAAKDIDTEQAKKAWEAMREEIIKSSDAGRDFVAKLELVDDVNDRIRQGFDYIDKIKQVNGALVEMDENAIKLQEDWSKWWNLWMGNDSLLENFKDFMGEFNDVVSNWGGIDELEKKARIDFGDAKDDLISYNDDLTTLNKNLAETAESMVKFFSQKMLNPEQEREGFNQIVNQMVQEWNLGTKEALQFRMLMEQQYANQRFLLYRKEDAKNAQANYQHWQEQFNMQQSLETEFLNWLTRNRYAATQEMFQGMTENEIKEIDWSEERWAKWAEENASEFAKQYNLSFDQLRSLVNLANSWSVRIPVFFNIQQETKNIFQQLEDADSRFQNAEKRIERLNAGIKSGKLNTLQLVSANKELVEAQMDLNKAIEDGGKSSKKKKAGADASKKAARQHKKEVDAVAEALKTEISLIKEMQSNYDKLRQSGVNNIDSIKLAAKGYEGTIEHVNKVLTKYGINKFSASDFTGKNVKELLSKLEQQRASLVASGRVKLASLKDLDVEIKNLSVDAKSYDMKKITDGLNHELSKIKDDYELSIELDANPELGDIFSNLFNLDRDAMPKNIEDVIRMYQDETDKALAEAFHKGADIDPQDMIEQFDLLTDDLEEWATSTGIQINSELYKQIEGGQKELQGLVKKYETDLLNETKALEYELADTVGKIAIEEKKLAELQDRLAKETNERRKHLLDLQIEKQKQAIDKLKETILSELPTYKALFNSIVEHSARVTRKLAKDYAKMLEDAKKRGKNNGGRYTVIDPQTGEKTTLTEKQLNKEIEKANGKLRETQTVFAKIREAFTKGEDGIIDWAMGLELVAGEAHKVADGIKQIGSIIESLGAEENVTEIINDIAESIDGMATATQGVAQIAGGDIVGGTVNVIKGVWQTVSNWFDNSNKKIDKKVKESETYVHSLELAYIDLGRAVEKSLGNAEISARKLAIANKQAQLEQLKNQLRLEESRKKKNRDDEKIIDLQKQIKELSNEISDMVDEITNNLLGSDIKSAAEDFVNTWVSAWRQGEDTMGELTSKFDDMIDQMIMKSLASKLVANRLKPIWDMVDNITSESSEGGTDITLNELKRIKNLMGDKSIAEAINTDLKNLYGALGIAYGSGNASKNLSNLQQGIQSITEDTAGALEAYMNGVSQQVYLHSDLLTQIRDAVVMMNGDAQLATQAQMLLQLQKNYILVQSMAVLMENWTIPSGNGIRVALVN